MSTKETLDKAAYTHVKALGQGDHLLKDESGQLEIWFENANHASYGLIYKKTHLEFARTATPKDLRAAYTPKPSRGQTFPGYIKITAAQVKKLFETGQTFEGFIVGNKVSAAHFFKGWHLACTLSSPTAEEFQSSLNSFLYYLDSELGTCAAIYLKKL